MELWVADATQPGMTERAREPLAAGQTVVFQAVASHAMVAVIGIAPTPGANPVFYRIDLVNPGTSTLIAAPNVPLGPGQFTLSPRGDWLGFIRSDVVDGGGTLARLHMRHTELPSVELVADFNYSQSTSYIGVNRFEFKLPRN